MTIREYLTPGRSPLRPIWEVTSLAACQPTFWYGANKHRGLTPKR
jgi:hypothetical protein